MDVPASWLRLRSNIHVWLAVVIPMSITALSDHARLIQCSDARGIRDTVP